MVPWELSESLSWASELQAGFLVMQGPHQVCEELGCRYSGL